MNTPDEASVRDALASIAPPWLGTDLVTAGVIKGIGIDGDRVAVDVKLGLPAKGVAKSLTESIEQRLVEGGLAAQATVNVGWRVLSHVVQGELTPQAGIRNIIAVASGKGGVGKSTTAVNLALALTHEGARVGVLDADIYGPSMPRMLGVSGKPGNDGKRIFPHEAYGIKVMSMGFLVEEDTPMIWRGPMVTSALQQLLGETDWGELDYLVVDLPPGTGDIQLTLVQKIPVAGAVIVTTPQDIALLDARKGIEMFAKVSVPVLGIIENMAMHVCGNCGHTEAIFGSDGGARIAEEYGVAVLASLPLDRAIRERTDAGTPVVLADPESAAASAYLQAADALAGALGPDGDAPGAPTITMSDD